MGKHLKNVLKKMIMTHRILMIGNDIKYMSMDALLLRQKGLIVYMNVNPELVNEQIEEIHPDVIFINWQQQNKQSLSVYHSILDNLRHVTIPVLFTLAEDDVYLINKKRTALKEERYLTSDNVFGAIKLALPSSSQPVKKRVRIAKPGFRNIATVYRD